MSLHNDIRILNDTIEKNRLAIAESEKENEKQKAKLYQYKVEIIEDLKAEIIEAYKQGKNLNDYFVKTDIIDAVRDRCIIIIDKEYTKALLVDNYDKEAKRLLTAQKQEKREEERQAKEEAKRQEAIRKNYIIQKQQEKQKRLETLQAISNLLLGLACLVGLPFILIIFFVIGITKSVK